MFRPEEDGVTHINVYSKGRTELGRLLSNFSHTPIHSPKTGLTFASLEALWYWLNAAESPERDQLRNLHGFAAKKKGRELSCVNRFKGEQFRKAIYYAMQLKLEQHPRIKEMLRESSLPLTHYYVFDGTVKHAGYEWIIEEWERLRAQLKKVFLFTDERRERCRL